MWRYLSFLYINFISRSSSGSSASTGFTPETHYLEVVSARSFLFTPDTLDQQHQVRAVIKLKSNDTIVMKSDDSVRDTKDGVVYPSSTQDGIIFSSSNPDVIDVDPITGLLTAKTADINSTMIYCSYQSLKPVIATAVIATLNSNVYLISSSDIRDDSNVTNGGSVYVARSNLTSDLKPGDILLELENEDISHKIVSIENNTSSQWYHFTVELVENYTDIFSDLSLNFATPMDNITEIIDISNDTHRRSEKLQICKAKGTSQPITVDFSDASIKYEASISLNAIYEMSIWRINTLRLFTLGVARVTVETGTAAVRSEYSGAIQCELKLMTIPLALLPLPFFTILRTDLTPKVGIEIAGSAEGRALSVTGPSVDLGRSLEIGVAYTTSTGFTRISSLRDISKGINWGSYNGPLNVAMTASAKAYLQVDLSIAIYGAKLFRVGGTGLAKVRFSGGADVEMSSPFRKTHFDYQGPSWRLFTEVYIGLDPLKKSIDGFLKLANRLGINAELKFDPTLYSQETIIATSINPTNIKASPIDTGYRLQATTDGPVGNDIAFFAYLFGDNDRGVEVARTKSTGDVAFADWTPPDDEIYYIRAMYYDGLFSKVGFPFASTPYFAIVSSIEITVTPDNLVGTPNAMYEFQIEAMNFPEDLSAVRFEWSFSQGSPGTRDIDIINRRVTTTISNAYLRPGTYTITVTVIHDELPIAIVDVPVVIEGVILDVHPPGLTNGEVNKPYIFSVLATRLDPQLSEVTFEWSFGTGEAMSSGEANIPVSDSTAFLTLNYTYSSKGSYGLVVAVSSGGEKLADRSVIVIIGEVIERKVDLTICNIWTVAQSGGVGVTTDVWDIGIIPIGAVFDISFNAYSVPDKFTAEYPQGNMVLDTGWRGSTSYSHYPGGIAGPGWGQVHAFFQKTSISNTFNLTVFGPDPGTLWEYSIRCRVVE